MVRMKIICVSVMRVLTVKPVCIYIYTLYNSAVA